MHLDVGFDTIAEKNVKTTPLAHPHPHGHNIDRCITKLTKHSEEKLVYNRVF